MKKIGTEFTGLDWSAEERADAVGSARAFSLDPVERQIPNDVAPMISSMLEDANFWEDESAVEPVDARAQFRAIQDTIPEVEKWLQNAPADDATEAVQAMLDELKKFSTLR